MKRDELPALTGARFYAAVLVFLNHVVFLPGCESWRAIPGFGLGGFGVTFFFVLSGFILAYNYEPFFRTTVSAAAYRLFLWDRFSKIYPTYVATLLLAIPVSVFSPTLPLDWVAVPVQALLIQCWLPFALPPYFAYLNSVGWSISCEAFFYLLTPLLIAAHARRPGGWVSWGATVTVLLLVYGIARRLVPPADPASELYFLERFAGVRIADFAVGVCLGMSVARLGPFLARHARLCQGAGLVWVVVILAFGSRLPFGSLGSVGVLPGVCLLILGWTQGDGMLGRHLSHPWLRMLGVSSFAFYMLHHLVLRYLKGAMLRVPVDLGQVGTLALVGATFAATCALSYGAYAWFEMPVQRAMRRWFRKRFPQPGP
jgi:peptidoglycan/LPS O-acetylase OafA/YrhL